MLILITLFRISGFETNLKCEEAKMIYNLKGPPNQRLAIESTVQAYAVYNNLKGLGINLTRSFILHVCVMAFTPSIFSV